MRDHAVLYLNGQRAEIRGPDLLLPLSTWLRERRRLTGTKVMCAQGDCGSCTVLVGRHEDPADAGLTYRAIASCIGFVFQADRAHVVTVEGLKEADGSLSAVQRALVDGHGSQCGFCTPGFAAAIHAEHEQRGRVAAAELTVGGAAGRTAWAGALCGNLCRCTGYLQILDAAGSVDPATLTRMNDRHPPAGMLSAFAEAAATPLDARFEDGGRARRVVAPHTLEDAAAFKAGHPGCRVAAGATDLGVQLRRGRFDPGEVLGLSAVGGFGRVEREDAGGGRRRLVIGAGATWAAVARAVERELPALSELLVRFGSPQVRNAGTVGGNLAHASPVADALPPLLALDAELELIAETGTTPVSPADDLAGKGAAGGEKGVVPVFRRRRVPLTGFYTGHKRTALRPEELIAAVRVPLPTPAQRLCLHKASRRRDVDTATASAAVLLEFEDPAEAGAVGARLRGARVALGGVAATALRVPAAEDSLAGARFTEDALRAAGRLARAAVDPISDARGSAAHRSRLCENLLVKSFHQIATAAVAAPGRTNREALA